MKTDTNQPPVVARIVEGDRVRLFVDLWDTAPSDRLLGHRNDVLTVQKIDPGHEFPYCVSHDGITNESFRVAASEIERIPND